MNIKKELNIMQERMFNDELLDTLITAYVQEREEHGIEDGEREYRTAKEALPALLSEEQKAALEKAEALCRENLRYAMRFSFSQGCYAGFQQFFVKDTPEDPFQTYVANQIMLVPNMSRYVEYDMRRDEINAIFEKLKGALRGEGREHMISLDSEWDNRLYGVLRHSFYMGYRYALSLIDTPCRIGEISYITGKILMTEYLLGFTATREERESNAESYE